MAGRPLRRARMHNPSLLTLAALGGVGYALLRKPAAKPATHSYAHQREIRHHGQKPPTPSRDMSQESKKWLVWSYSPDTGWYESVPRKSYQSAMATGVWSASYEDDPKFAVQEFRAGQWRPASVVERPAGGWKPKGDPDKIRNPRRKQSAGVRWTSRHSDPTLSTKLYPTKSAAEKVAAQLQANDEDWTYKVKESPSTGMWRVEIYDEDGLWVANYSPDAARNPSRLVRNPYKDKILLPSGNIQYVYGPEDVAKRQRQKAQRIEEFKGREEALIKAVKRDVKKGDDTALAIGLIMTTYERPGNAESAREGHYGVTGWECRHLSNEGKNAVALDYVGKSGVQQHKVVSDPDLVRALRARQRACKRRGDKLLDTSPSSVNRYLEAYGVRAKDLRTFGANIEMQAELTRLRKAGPRLSTLKARDLKRTLKAEFMAAVATVAGKLGHTTTMLRRQYLVKEMEPTYVASGRIVKAFA